MIGEKRWAIQVAEKRILIKQIPDNKRHEKPEKARILQSKVCLRERERRDRMKQCKERWGRNPPPSTTILYCCNESSSDILVLFL